MGEHIERYVPVGRASLVDDAPGWSGESKLSAAAAPPGPICWKCRGTGNGKKSKKRPRNKGNDTSPRCTVCQGTGHLPVKKQEALAPQNLLGEITRVRACPEGWKPQGPLPFALQKESQKTPNQQEAARLVHLAETSKKEVPVILDDTTTSTFDTSHPLPTWLPQRGEQLCNLVGSWRILQRVASHRWTTDDLVTSYMAGRLQLREQKEKTTFRYLDLGCGNGSVLLMTTWQLCTRMLVQSKASTEISLACTGIEARQEAVHLARRSIAFNLGQQINIQVHHGDFRSTLDSLIQDFPSQRYDLVTGTPPYFQVDFTVENSSVVRQAVVHQGGMPTCKQSAPARCEFRGGIEAYCQAASRAMHKESLFCVCENWLNNDRVYQGAKEANLVIAEVLPVQGRTGKPCPLFAVYAMRKQEFFEGIDIPKTKILDSLAVRDDKGNWTDGYQKILEAVSIPVGP